MSQFPPRSLSGGSSGRHWYDALTGVAGTRHEEARAVAWVRLPGLSSTLPSSKYTTGLPPKRPQRPHRLLRYAVGALISSRSPLNTTSTS